MSLDDIPGVVSLARSLRFLNPSELYNFDLREG